jgi:hypothetical protein
MANNFNKTINLNVNATTGLKTLDELKVKSEELQKTIESLDITSIDFKNTRQELDAVNSKIKTFGQSSQEASDIATEAFVKTSQAIVGTTGTLLTFAASNDQADKVTAKLAKTLALVDSIEKISQATKAASIFLQDKANEATAAGVVQTGLFARAQAFLTTGITGVGTALKNLYVVLLANPFTAILATIGLVTAGIFAFTKSTQELIDEQQKLYEQTVATNDAVLAYNDAIRESIVIETKRKNLRKGEEKERQFAIDSIKEAQINADQAILDFEKKVAKERKAIVDSFYFSVFGFTTENLQKFKDFDIELKKLKTDRANLDTKLKNQETKNSADVNKNLNEDTQKQIELRRAQLENLEDYSSKAELISLDRQSAIADIQEREANGDKNTYNDREIARIKFDNAIAKLNKEEEQRKLDALQKQEDIDEKFDAKEKALNDKRYNEELARQKANDEAFDKRLEQAAKNREALIALGEVDNDSIRQQIESDKVAFETKIELINKLFEIEKKRILFNRDELLRNEKLSKEEIATIKAKTDAQVKALTSAKDATVELEKQKGLDALLDQFDKLTDAVDNFNSALDEAGVDKGSGIRAINDSVSTLIKAFRKAKEDGTVTITEITQVALQTLATVSEAVNEAVQASAERNIENIEKVIESIEEKRQQVEDNINESLSKQKDLESKLSEARVGDREKILKAIDAERAREKQLLNDKKRFAEEESKLEEKKKEEKRKAAIAQKIASTSQAIASTALAVIAPWTNPLTVAAAPVLSAIAFALGALQIATIAAVPIPQFKSGGPTRSSSSDNDVAGIVHANEYVISAPIVRSPKFKSVINEIEKARQTGSFQSGGFTSPASSDAENQLERVLQQSIDLSNRPIVVTVVDINAGQSRVAQVIDQATL